VRTQTDIRHPKKRAFLAAYRQSGNIRASCEAADVARSQFYVWCECDDRFAVATRVAKEEFGDLLEAKLSQLAMRQDNVTALIVALKMAGRFVERTRQEVSGPEGGPIELTRKDPRVSLEAKLAKIRAHLDGQA
jgi:hypothetical protein